MLFATVFVSSYVLDREYQFIEQQYCIQWNTIVQRSMPWLCLQPHTCGQPGQIALLCA